MMDGKEESLARIDGTLAELLDVMKGIEQLLGFMLDAREDLVRDSHKGQYTPKHERPEYVAPHIKYKRSLTDR